MWLNFVSLENNKMFLHTTASTQTWDEIVQQIMVHQYCRDNLPQRIVFRMPLDSLEQVDEIVLLFRDLFGAEDTCANLTVHLLESTQIESSTAPCLSTVQG